MKLMQIGEVSRLSGLPVRTVHYYEDRGLVEPADRTEAGYRLYGREELARLRFISRAKLLGLTLEETRKLVGLAAGCNRGEIVPDLEEILREKLRETDRKMEELAAFKENLLLRRLTDAWLCRVFGETLAAHSRRSDYLLDELVLANCVRVSVFGVLTRQFPL